MKQLIILIPLIGITYLVNAQCNGNLGENIFTDGDFGSGTANILTPDPQIAPGYTYESNPPPIDGTYTITNNTSNWGGFANPNWANISDNSPDPNGYMMIVNGSFDPGLFYEQQINDLCENTLYVFSVDIYNLAAGIQPNVSFLLDGINILDSGNIPLNNQWNTYEATFTTGLGQNSVTLALQNNAPGGNGNDLALDNISFKVCGPEANISPEETVEMIFACTGGNPITLGAVMNGTQYDDPQVQWQESLDGINWTGIPGANNITHLHTNMTQGIYYYRYLLANGVTNLLNNKCRIISSIKIINITEQNYQITDTICSGLSYEMGDILYTTTGVYIDTFTTALGCDSILTLNLEVIPDAGINVSFIEIDPSCKDFTDGSISINSINNAIEPYIIEFNGAIHPDGNVNNLESGAYDYKITDRYGCDFETTINLFNPILFEIDLGDNVLVELGETVEIIPAYTLAASNFDWITNPLVDCGDDCQTLEWTPSQSTSVVLNAVTANGCEATDSLYVNVFNVRNVFIPNTFTPNSDGYNDRFNIYADTPNVIGIDELNIFNRWGSLVHHRTDFLPNEVGTGWDGYYKGKPLESGVYVYSVKIRFLDNEVLLYKGDITLIR